MVPEESKRRSYAIKTTTGDLMTLSEQFATKAIREAEWIFWPCMSNVGSNCDCKQCRDGRELKRLLSESNAEIP